jgi:hypothetical protein
MKPATVLEHENAMCKCDRMPLLLLSTYLAEDNRSTRKQRAACAEL